MTNDVAIKRKLIYQGITLTLWAIMIFVFYSGMTSTARDIVLFSTIELPIFLTIILSKIIRTFVFILGTYNSNVKFEKYSDVAKNLPKIHKNIYNVTRPVAMIIFAIIIVWSAISILFIDNPIKEDIKDVTLENYTVTNCSIENSDFSMTYSANVLPASTYTSGMKCPLIVEGAEYNYQGVLSVTAMKDCPYWATKKIYSKALDKMKLCVDLETEKIYEINENGVKGCYTLTNNGSHMQLVISKGNDYFYILIGDYGYGVLTVDHEKVLDFALEWLEKY